MPEHLHQQEHFFFGCHFPPVFGSGLVDKPSRTREELQIMKDDLTGVRMPYRFLGNGLKRKNVKVTSDLTLGVSAACY
jgi:hypothetical protein